MFLSVSVNDAAKISIGVMGGLAFVAGCLIIALLYVRHRRRKNQLARPPLVEYCEDPGQSTPRHSGNFDSSPDIMTQNSINNSHVTTPTVNNGSVRGPRTQNQLLGSIPALETECDTESTSHDANNVSQMNLDTGQGLARVRYSDMLENYKDVHLKISDC